MSLLVETDAQASRSPPPPISPPLYSPGATSSPSVSLTVNSSFPAAMMMSYSNSNSQSSSPTGSSADLPNGKTGGSIIKETVSSSPVKLYQLSDFKGLTYRGTVQCGLIKAS